MKKIGVLAVVMAMAFLFVGAASAEMYVEGYIGGSMASSTNHGVSVLETTSSNWGFGQSNFNLKTDGAVEPSVLGGVKVGTWFVKEGTLGWSGYPDWAKYFGFYTDFSYQRLYTRDNRASGTEYYQPYIGGSQAFNIQGFMKSEGMVATWAFMLAARYGFFADSEVPFGRLQPYVAAGPAILFSSSKPKIWTQYNQATGVPFIVNSLVTSPGNQSSVDIGLAVDAGVRYMCLKNVSVDVSFKYRYANPHYDYAGQDGLNGVPCYFSANPQLNMYSFQAGVAYHF